MTIDYDKLLALDFPETTQSWTGRDTILYALGVGVGLNPSDTDALPFVYEANLKALPTLAVVLGHPGFWVRDRDTGIDWVKVVHGEQGLVLHRPLPAAGRVVARHRVVDAVDKGAGRGAVVYYERVLTDAASGEPLATVSQTVFCRGDGGFEGPATPRPQPQPHRVPDRAPDLVCDLPTSPQAALIYRLSGDLNPLHVDPTVARAAGYPQPILHGLATYGVAGHALLKTVCAHDPARLRSLNVRFSAPVFPGETFRTEMWIDGEVVSFQVRCLERDVLAITNGRAELRG